MPCRVPSSSVPTAAPATASARSRTAFRAALGGWIASPEGQRDAYRPNERILPSNFASKASWDRYLADLRARRAAVVADILPDLTGVELVLDADPDFIDHSHFTAEANAKVAKVMFDEFVLLNERRN